MRNALPDPTNGLTAAIEIERKFSAEAQDFREAELLKIYDVSVEAVTIAGVPCRLVTPPAHAVDRARQFLINLHGGAFRLGAGSIAEAVPIATRVGVPVLAVNRILSPQTD